LAGASTRIHVDSGDRKPTFLNFIPPLFLDLGDRRLLRGIMAQSDAHDLPPRKKLKLSDLPLTQAKRTAIDGLLHTFKKKGEFDSIRKKAFAQFNEGVS
jgi:hypothetical protein